MGNQLSPGDVRVGHISDGVGEGPIQSGTMTFDEEAGMQLLVPFLRDDPETDTPQFARTSEWFRFTSDSTPPKTLLFFDNDGIATLVDNRLGAASLGAYPLGRLRPQCVIFERPRHHRSEYLVRDFKSTIDGLEDFAGFQPIEFRTEPTAGSYRTTVVIEPSERVEWEVDSYRFVIQANVSWAGVDGRSFTSVAGEPYLRTTNESGATPHDHLAAQWSIRSLLLLSYGTKLAWRSHLLRDEEFPMWMMAGDPRPAVFVNVSLAGTVRQHRDAVPDPAKFHFAAFRLADLGSQGMKRWGELYRDETFERALQPAVEVLNGATTFLEPQLMMLAISLDRLGQYRHGDGKRRALWENIERCLVDADLDWPLLGSRVGIAKAIANLNNDLKHPGRDHFPATDELAGASICRRSSSGHRCSISSSCRQACERASSVRTRPAMRSTSLQELG